MRCTLPLVALLALLGARTAVAGEDPDSLRLDGRALPEGWKVEHVGEVPPAARAAVARRLGAPLDGLWNHRLSMNGFPVQVNVLQAADDEGARAVEASVAGTAKAEAVARRGHWVMEVMAPVLAARAVRAAVGVPRATQSAWEVELRLGLLDDGDDGACNDLYQAFLALEQDSASAGPAARIAETTKDWRFGETLRLVLPGEFLARHDLAFEPPPAQEWPAVPAIVRRFADPPRTHGIPFVEVKGRIAARARYAPEGEPALPAGRRQGLLGSTRRWPAGDDFVRARVEHLTRGLATPRQRLLALLRETALGLRHGEKAGTRLGVARVLAQGAGQCWDKSDVLVTMCRAAGLPARQVAGWVPAIGQGHVWAEAHLEGEGWIPVDGTCSWLGISEDYLPLFATEDGEMRILHLRRPVLRPVEGP